MTLELVIALVAAILGGISLALHVIAPLTKTTVDDKIRDDVDWLKDKVLQMHGAPASTPRQPPGSGTTLAVFALLVLAIGGLGTGCSTVKAVPVAAAHAVVDCTKQDATKLLALALDFAGQGGRYLIAGIPIDWDGLEAEAEHEGSAIGQCAFVEVLAALHPPRSSSPDVAARAAPDPATIALERLRKYAGGVTWQLPSGVL